jgi:hypothetical protein
MTTHCCALLCFGHFPPRHALRHAAARVAPAPAPPGQPAAPAQMREAGEKITMLTAYDATFAAVADAAGSSACWWATRWAWSARACPAPWACRWRPWLPHRKRGARPAPGAGHGLAGGRPALWQLPRIAASKPAQRLHADAGGRAHGQAGRRRLDGRDGALFGRARHSRLRPPGPDAANRARPGRLPRAGQNRPSRANPAPPRTRAARRRCRHAGAGDGARQLSPS